MVGDDVTHLHRVVLFGILLTERVLFFSAITLKVDALITSISCTDHMTAHALITWMIIH